jgi:hypothetical protein
MPTAQIKGKKKQMTKNAVRSFHWNTFLKA